MRDFMLHFLKICIPGAGAGQKLSAPAPQHWFVTFFENPPMLNIRFGTRAVGAEAGAETGATSIFGYGSSKKKY
jgi:hypothetical protein